MGDFLLTFPPLDLPGVEVVFTTRRGGVSENRYASCNLGLHVGDDPAKVAANRRLVLAGLGLGEDRFRVPNQVHGREVAMAPWSGPPPEADAVVTRETGLLIGVLTADCLPVVMVDPVARVAAAAHAGWRGARDGVVGATLAVMTALGARPDRVFALLGPAIQPDNYMVGPEFVAEFPPRNGTNFLANHREIDEKFTLDIPGLVASQLLDGGLKPDHVVNPGFCTFANHDLFFSHRRASQQGEAPCGRQLGGIILR